MIAINPTGKELEIMYKGIVYSIPANGQTNLPDEVASHWKEHIHQFIELKDDSVKAPAKKEVAEVAPILTPDAEPLVSEAPTSPKKK